MENIPPEAVEWFREEDMYPLQVKPMQGRFTSSLFKVTVKTTENHQDFICKLIPKSNIEGKLYHSLLRREDSLAPFCYAARPTTGGTVLILQYFGSSLKEELTHLSSTQATRLLAMAATKLADMHGMLEQRVDSERSAGTLLPSLHAAAQPWRQKAIDELKWLQCKEELKCNLADMDALVHIAQTWIQIAAKRYARTSQRLTITHGDPHLGNWLIKRNEVRLIDWEYAGLSIPQRDLSVLLQDILDGRQRETVFDIYMNALGKHGWDISSESFLTDFQIHFLDNTLMMLGWDISSFRLGMLEQSTFLNLVNIKSKWIQETAAAVL